MHARIASLIVLSGLAFPSSLLAQPDEAMPVSAVTLYRSGVGSFERQGTVTGDETVSLAFDADQINDILKSLVVIDLDGGRVGAVSYSSDEPIGRRLEALGLDHEGQLTLARLLGEFQGARIDLTSTSGEITGRILGVDGRELWHDDQFEEFIRLSIATNEGIVTVDEHDIRSVRLLDESLQSDLNDLLIALGTQRTEQSRSVEIDLRGVGDRRVRAAYVQETPIWKTSYRLVLPEGEGDDLHIEGWAIVENTTDHDWENITLTLVAGRPVGFEMDLSTPLYISRPEIAVPVEVAAAPKMYDRGRGGGQSPFDDVADEMAVVDRETRDYRLTQESNERNRRGVPSTDAPLGLAGRSLSAEMGMSTVSMASGGDEGEVFFYRLDNPVSVGKRESAMLPIITGPIEGRRVSVFSPSTQGQHPYRGVELTNSTGLKLMPGPLSVFDGSVFAGDSQMGYIGAEENRMLAYAVDLDVDAERTTNQNTTTQNVRILDGVIHLSNVVENEYTVTLDNHDSKRDRMIVVEVPRFRDWTLSAEIKPYEETDGLYRFEIEVGSGETESLTATQTRTQSTTMALTSASLPTLLSYQRQGAASQAVIDAYKGYASRRAAVDDARKEIEHNESEYQRIENDQRRIRDLLRSINRQDALYARYMGQLETHEDSLDELRSERQTLVNDLAQKEQQLDLYVRTLRVE
ncbi:MAG: DUF4139 domain-containing protein [Phycisphaera sp.]|nr:MAG: DUF4139 domain-containing protein [Phycisphaera sp.]